MGRVHRQEEAGRQGGRAHATTTTSARPTARRCEQVAKDKGFTIVESKLHEGTATNLDNEITAILAADPDVVLGETTGKFCPMLMAGLAAGGYKGITLISATCARWHRSGSRSTRPATACTSLGQQKDPSDPQYADDPAMKQYMADVAQYGAGADPKNGSVRPATTSARCWSTCCTRAAKLDGGLTRANIMNAAWATDIASAAELSAARPTSTASRTPTRRVRRDAAVRRLEGLAGPDRRHLRRRGQDGRVPAAS